MLFFKRFQLTKKQKRKGIALCATGATVAVGSLLVKKKVNTMKEDGSYDFMVFKYRLNKYLKCAKNDKLNLQTVDHLLESLDKMDEVCENNENIVLDLDDETYTDLHIYLDEYASNLAKSNNIQFNDSTDTKTRLKQCLNTQKFILESFS